jgi:putative heme degradation protein
MERLMDGETYLAILKENELKRSKLVKLLEKQVAILYENDLTDLAEETKWIAIDIAEFEKKNGVIDI